LHKTVYCGRAFVSKFSTVCGSKIQCKCYGIRADANAMGFVRISCCMRLHPIAFTMQMLWDSCGCYCMRLQPHRQRYTIRHVIAPSIHHPHEDPHAPISRETLIAEARISRRLSNQSLALHAPTSMQDSQARGCCNRSEGTTSKVLHSDLRVPVLGPISESLTTLSTSEPPPIPPRILTLQLSDEPKPKSEALSPKP
jgi:hypothetical protein